VVTAIPAGMPATVVVEVADAGEQQPLAVPSGVEVRWLLRSDGEDLVSALQALPLPAGTGQVWVGCEASDMRAIRRHLLDSGVPRDQLATRGYWRRGEEGYTDHDLGEDVQ
jgi:NADPH-dependent ferric siderophore reductase